MANPASPNNPSNSSPTHGSSPSASSSRAADIAPLPMAVLLSGSGRTLQNLADEIAADRLHANLRVVIASRPDVFGLERARNLGLPAYVVERKAFASVDAFSEQVYQHVRQHGAEWIALAGWLSLLRIPADFTNRVLNIHPSLLPSFGGKGMFGHHVHEAVLEHGCKVTGCTVHIADESYDTGPIIVQRTCPVLPDDDAETLAARVFEQESLAYPQAINAFAENRVTITGRTAKVQPPR